MVNVGKVVGKHKRCLPEGDLYTLGVSRPSNRHVRSDSASLNCLVERSKETLLQGRVIELYRDGFVEPAYKLFEKAFIEDGTLVNSYDLLEIFYENGYKDRLLAYLKAHLDEFTLEATDLADFLNVFGARDEAVELIFLAQKKSPLHCIVRAKWLFSIGIYEKALEYCSESVAFFEKLNNYTKPEKLHLLTLGVMAGSRSLTDQTMGVVSEFRRDCSDELIDRSSLNGLLASKVRISHGLKAFENSNTTLSVAISNYLAEVLGNLVAQGGILKQLVEALYVYAQKDSRFEMHFISKAEAKSASSDKINYAIGRAFPWAGKVIVTVEESKSEFIQTLMHEWTHLLMGALFTFTSANPYANEDRELAQSFEKACRDVELRLLNPFDEDEDEAACFESGKKIINAISECYLVGEYHSEYIARYVQIIASGHIYRSPRLAFALEPISLYWNDNVQPELDRYMEGHAVTVPACRFEKISFLLYAKRVLREFFDFSFV